SNPDASWRTRLMSIALGSIHTLRSRARERLGVSCGLHGNGMCFTSALLRKVPYDAFSITEDLEYSLRLAEAGHRVVYAAEARVFGDMPVSERASRTQRERWEGGRGEMARLHAPGLCKRALKNADSIALDRAIDLLLPPLTTIVATLFIGLAACAMLSVHAGAVIAATWLWVASILMVLIYVARGWQLSGTGVRGLTAFLHVPIYLVWKLTLPLRRREHARGEWVRTAREREPQ
ncbi:MAG: glycosyltransferase family 2 protein, partial [Polyangiaceae bacterium]